MELSAMASSVVLIVVVVPLTVRPLLTTSDLTVMVPVFGLNERLASLALAVWLEPVSATNTG